MYPSVLVTGPLLFARIVLREISRCPPADLIKFDVVLTTYSVIETEFRKMIEPTKVNCPYCGKKFLAEKLKVCGMKQSSGADSVYAAHQKPLRSAEFSLTPVNAVIALPAVANRCGP